MGGLRKPLQKRKAFELFKKEVTQKQIASDLKVSEKTVGVWAKEYRTKLESSTTEKKLINDIELLKQQVIELKEYVKKEGLKNIRKIK